MVGSLFSWNSLLTNRRTTDDFPTAASPWIYERHDTGDSVNFNPFYALGEHRHYHSHSRAEPAWFGMVSVERQQKTALLYLLRMVRPT